MPTQHPTAAPASIAWPEPYESAYQAQQRRHGPTVPGARRPDITRPLRLLIASIVDLADERPHGMITWLAEVLATSRETIYTVGETWSQPPGADKPTATEAQPVDRKQLARAALTLLVEGAVQLRPAQRCLKALIGQRRSLGWLCQLIDDAGERAGAVLAAADWSGATRLIVSRDELFMSDLAWLLTVDTRSHAIVSGHVETQVDAETWAVSLALDADKTGGRIEGLAEDAAKWYPLSVSLAQALLGTPFNPDVQKDNWHLLRQARQTVRDAERIALRHLATAERKASRVRPGFMIIRDFDGWEAAHERAARAIATADAICTGVDLLHEALELVDRRSGRIIDRATAEWYLDEIIAHLRRTESDLAEALAGTIERQADQLLCFHNRLATALDIWRSAALAHFEAAEVVAVFEQAIARAWRLERAVTNGRRQAKAPAQRAAAYAQALCQGDGEARHLADCLHAVLDGTVRTSSASENFNSILRAYLWGRRYLRGRRTAQNWLNLLERYS